MEDLYVSMDTLKKESAAQWHQAVRLWRQVTFLVFEARNQMTDALKETPTPLA